MTINHSAARFADSNLILQMLYPRENTGSELLVFTCTKIIHHSEDTRGKILLNFLQLSALSTSDRIRSAKDGLTGALSSGFLAAQHTGGEPLGVVTCAAEFVHVDATLGEAGPVCGSQFAAPRPYTGHVPSVTPRKQKHMFWLGFSAGQDRCVDGRRTPTLHRPCLRGDT